MTHSFSRRELVRDAALTPSDFDQTKRRRRPANRLGFAYQIGFVRLLNRFPAQQPFEIIDELLTYTAVQIDIDGGYIMEYARYQHTVSDHQTQIRQILDRKSFTDSAEAKLQRFLFDEACRLEQSAALVAQAEQYLRAEGILQPADYRLGRLVGEQRKVAREQIFQRIADSLSPALQETLDGLLLVDDRETTSTLQRIKAIQKNLPQRPFWRSPINYRPSK